MRWLRQLTPQERFQRAVERLQMLGIRGTIVCEEPRLPDDFEPPSAALAPPP